MRSSSSHRQNSGEMEPSLPQRKPCICPHGVSEDVGRSPDSSHAHYISPQLCPLPAHSWEAGTTTFQTLFQKVNFMEPAVSKAGVKDIHLPKDQVLKYKVSFQLSLVRSRITFELTGKKWIVSRQQWAHANPAVCSPLKSHTLELYF